MKGTIYNVWLRRNSHIFEIMWRKTCNLFCGPPERRDCPMNVSVANEKAKFSGNVESFDEATCDYDRLYQVVSSYKCMNTSQINPTGSCERQLSLFNFDENILSMLYLFGFKCLKLLNLIKTAA